MIREDVTEVGGVKVGDTVMVIKDSGFQQGVAQAKTVRSIRLITWDEAESRRLGVRSREVVYVFTDNSTAGTYDTVTPIRSPNCE